MLLFQSQHWDNFYSFFRLQLKNHSCGEFCLDHPTPTSQGSFQKTFLFPLNLKFNMGRDHPVSSLFAQHLAILWTTYLLVKRLLSEWHVTKYWEKKYTLSENHLYWNNWRDYFLSQFHFSDFPQTKLLRNRYFNISARGGNRFYNKTMMNASISLVFTEGAHASVWWETGGGSGTQAKSSGLCNITVLSQIKQWMEKNRFLRRSSSGGLGCSSWPLTGLHP